MQRTKPPTQSGSICRFFSRPNGCRHGDSCRFRHVSESRTPPPEGSVKHTNNQNPPPDNLTLGCDDTTTYTRDARYYGPDDTGIFLVDGTLFKVHATQVFGPRPASTPKSTKTIRPVYIEDVLPRLNSSSDRHPIALPGITAEQFRNYLLAITCRPGDKDFSTFADGYGYGVYRDERLQRVYILYVDIATLARHFGMVELENWAISILRSIFMDINPHKTVTRFASRNWSAGALFHLRTLSRNTGLDQPVITFIQYFISINLRGVSDRSYSANSHNIRACIDLYDIVKHPNVDPILLGCIFLNLLSLGHRSQIWSESVTRNDRAILYAAQVQFSDVTTELQNWEWLNGSPPILALAGGRFLCSTTCENKLTGLWRKYFGKLGEGLGSGVPLKDLTLLSQVAKNRWDFHQEWKEIICDTCRSRGWLRLPSNLTDFLDGNIRNLYQEVAYRYRELVEEEV